MPKVYEIENWSAWRLAKWAKEHRACLPARRFQKGKSLKQFWATCPEGDWMIWFLGYMCDGDIDGYVLYNVATRVGSAFGVPLLKGENDTKFSRRRAIRIAERIKIVGRPKD